MQKFVLLLILIVFGACVEDDVRRGNDALRIGDYQRAISYFSKSLDQEPAHRDARYGLALSYYTVAEDAEQLHLPSFDLWKRAYDEFKILENVDNSGAINANYSTCLFYLARATLIKEESANVLPLLNKSIQLDSSNYFSMNLKGLVLGKRKNVNDVEKAKKLFIHIISKEPKFTSAYVNLGNLYWNEGDVESAWDIWSLGLEKSPGDKALIRWTKIAEDSLKAKILSGEL